MHIDINSDEMKAKVADLKREHGPLRFLQHMGHGIIIRRASEAEWEAYFAMIADERRRSGAHRFLVDVTAVWPERSEVQAMFKSLPGLAQNFGTEASEFNGNGNREVEKKDL